MNNYSVASQKIRSIFWDVPESEYRAYPAISQSALTKYDREGFRTIEQETETTGAMIRGSLIDCLLTEGEEVFNSKYYVATYCEITDKPKKIVDILYEHYGHLYEELELVPESYILRVIKEQEYYSNRKDRTNINNIIKEGTIYYRNLIKGKGKTVVLKPQYDEAKATSDCLKQHQYTSKFFNPDKLSEYEEIIYQPKIILKDPRLPYELKCMYDLIYINHKEKYILPMDLKTTSSNEEDFERNYVNWRYDIQSSLYTCILKHMLKVIGLDYEIKNFTFIVVNPSNLTPILWEDVNCFNFGDRINQYGTLYKGPFTLAREYYYYTSSKNYSYDIEAVNNNGIKKLDIFHKLQKEEK